VVLNGHFILAKANSRITSVVIGFSELGIYADCLVVGLNGHLILAKVIVHSTSFVRDGSFGFSFGCSCGCSSLFTFDLCYSCSLNVFFCNTCGYRIFK